MVAQYNVTHEELIKMIEFKQEAPFFKFTTAQGKKIDNMEDLTATMSKYIMELLNALKDIPDFAPRLARVPVQATEVAKGAPGEFSELDFASKARMVKSTLSSISKVKDTAEKMKDEMDSVNTDLNLVKTSFEKLKEMMDSKEIIELGKKCQVAKKQTIKDCFECAFEPIKPAGKDGAGGANGCCTIF